MRPSFAPVVGLADSPTVAEIEQGRAQLSEYLRARGPTFEPASGLADLLRERLRAQAAAGATGGDTPWGTLTRDDGSPMTEDDVEQLAREMEEDREGE